MIKHFLKYQEVTVDELHELWKTNYISLYSFGNFVNNIKNLFGVRVL